jgi:hypothetical protein
MVVMIALTALPSLALGQSWRDVSMSRQASGEDELDVEVVYGAGRFKVRAAEGRHLYRMQLRYDEDMFEPDVEYDHGRLHLGVDHIGMGRSRRSDRGGNGGEMDLELGRGIPMHLDLAFGAVRAELDLGGLSLLDLDLSTGASESTVDVSEPNPVPMRVANFEVGAADFEARDLGNLNARRIDVSAGVGEVTLWFTGEWRQDARASLKIGLGSLELHFPEGLGVRINKNSFLTSFDSQGLVKRGDSYYSLNWDDADRKVSIDLDAAFGSVRVLWVG